MPTNYVDSLLPDSEAKIEGKILFDPSCLPRLVDEGAVLVDEGDVVARDMGGCEEDLDFLEGGGMDSAGESWRPYLLCNMDSAAA